MADPVTEHVSFLDLLQRLCDGHGWAMLLTATHADPADHLPFAQPRAAATVLKNLDIVRPVPGTKFDTRSRRYRLRGGELIVRCSLDKVGGDLDAAAEILVDLLANAREQAA